MPELPDIEVYLEHIRRLALGSRLERIELASPFLLRSVEPKPAQLRGRKLVGATRLGKRVVLELQGEHYAILHLMIAGRLHWLAPDTALHKKRTMVAFHFEPGILQLTEAGSKRRASLHLAAGKDQLADHDPGGLDPFSITRSAFGKALRAENHTLKRVLTDPRVFSGIGNAYSDEILHRAGLSPVAMSQKLDDDAIVRLHRSTKAVLGEWVTRLREAAGDTFPEGVTAFRPEMSVHGRYGEPCPVCDAPVQKIVYAARETNYCPTCQTGGKLLADRALSRLLKRDWPRSLEEMEERRAQRRDG